MFAHTVQPPLISLLNSSSIPSLSPIWTAHTDAQLPEDSTVCLVMDDEPASKETSIPVGQGWATSQQTQDPPQAASGSTTAFIPKHTVIGALAQPVIHLQSPTIRTTYIHSSPLGITLPWLGLQFRRLGTREVAVEVGVVDAHGNAGRIRCSSFQTSPTVRFSDTGTPVLHLPLKFPTDAPLTPWLELQLDIPSLVPLFRAPDLSTAQTTRRLPRNYASTTYVRIYANCRVKRVWMSARGDAVARGGEAVKDEWGMYSRRL